MTLPEIVSELRKYNFECEEGTLESSVPFQELARMARPDSLHVLFVEMYTAYDELGGVCGLTSWAHTERWKQRYQALTGHEMKP